MPTTTPFNNLITFSRGSNATVTGSNGLIQWAPNNLLTFSEQFNDGAWTKAGTTISANTTAAPDGTTTADKQVEDTSTGDHRILNNIGATVTANVTYTWSVYAKAAERTSVRVTNNSLIGATFDLTDGTFSNVSGGITATSTSVGNGWYRLIITGLAATSTERIAVYLVSGGATSYTGNGTSGAFIWGAQLELGSTATTYNPTTVKNLLGFSEAFDNAGWQKLGSSIVTGAQANPVNGLFNAQKLMEDTSTGIHRTFQTVTIAAGPHTLSFYAKSAGRDWIYINASGALYTAFVNVATGAVGATVGSPTVTMTPIGSGWYRVAMTYQNATAGASNQQIWLASNSTTTSYTGDGNSGVYIYGAQLSDSASLDPYVPTPGAAPSSTAFYGPRFDFDPVTRAPRGLLVEEQRTNLLVRSEEIDNASWTKNNTTVVANNTTAPDGTMTADRVTPTASSTTHLVRQGPTTTAVVHAQTVFYKPSGYTKVAIREDFAVGQYASFSCVGAGSIINKTAAASAEIVALQNGWYRLTLVPTTTTANQGMGVYIMADGYTTGDPAGYSYAGDGVSGGFIWGAQLEAGAFATSYIPTVASTVTRSADVATISGSLFNQWYGQTEGSFVASVGLLASFNFPVPFMAADSAAVTTKRIQIYLSGTAPTYRVTDGTDQAAINTAAVTIPSVSNFATAYQANNFAATVNGAAVATDSSGTVPAVNTFYIGNQASTQFLNGHIRAIRFIPARAADFQLQALST